MAFPNMCYYEENCRVLLKQFLDIFNKQLNICSPDNGAVFTQTAIDRESQLGTNGAVILTIRAQEVGGPFEPFVETEVTILIEV
jgi:hypothetical protein